jgi:tyrosyl-tRNA synthetase
VENLAKPFVIDGTPDDAVSSIGRDEKWGGPSHFKALEDEFAEKKVHPGDLKNALTKAISELLKPIRGKYEFNPEWKDIEAKAYPSPKDEKAMKKKKVSS